MPSSQEPNNALAVVVDDPTIPNADYDESQDQIINIGDGVNPTVFKKKRIVKKQVPYIKEVKVPVVTKKIVPAAYQKKFQVKRYVEEEEYEEIEEKYTVYETVTETREKVVYEEQYETEEYERRVPVKRERIVKKPIVRFEERVVYQEVELESSQLVEVDGYRIDEVEDIQVIEVEEWEVFELHSQPTGEKFEGEERELPEGAAQVAGGSNYANASRTVGTVIYLPEDITHELARLEEDLSLGDINSGARVHDFDTYKSKNYPLGSEGKAAPAMESSPKKSAPAEDNVKRSQNKYEGFDLEKCLAFSLKELSDRQAEHDLDPEEWVDVLRNRWMFVDKDASGLVSLDELREAVWLSEEDNEGIPMPEGKFDKSMQDIVDQIHQGTGGSDEFSFWDFINYMLGDSEAMTNVVIQQPSNDWARVRK